MPLCMKHLKFVIAGTIALSFLLLPGGDVFAAPKATKKRSPANAVRSRTNKPKAPAVTKKTTKKATPKIEPKKPEKQDNRPLSMTQIIQKEIVNTHTKIKKIFPDRVFYPLDNTVPTLIANEITKHPLSSKDQERIAKYAARVLASLRPDWGVSAALGDIEDYRPFLNIIHPNEDQALNASIEYILKKQISIHELTPKTNDDLLIVIQAAINKEVYKLDFPAITKQTAERLLQVIDPSYHYRADAMDDPLNNLVLVKMGPELFAFANGGGTINIEDESRTKEELGLTILHEKLHTFMLEKFQATHQDLHGEEYYNRANRGFQEIGVTAFQYLLATNAGVPTTKLEGSDYWDGAKDLIKILETLKADGNFDWQKEKDTLFLLMADGNLEPILARYATLKGRQTGELLAHFEPLRDDFFLKGRQENYQDPYFTTIDTFVAERAALGL